MARLQMLPMLSILACAGWASASENPAGLNENHPYGRLTRAYVTPHVAWAEPYYLGPIRILVIAPAWSQRETVELAERLSVDYTPWMSATFKTMVGKAESDPAFSFFQAPPEVVQRAGTKALGQEYDAIIVGKMDWSALPGKQRFELLRKVSEGTGFLYVNPPQGNPELDLVFSRRAAPEGTEFITANLPLGALPRLRNIRPESLARTGLFGKGRVVALDYREPASATQNDGDTCAWPCLTPQWDLTETKEGFQPLESLPEAELVPYEYYQALVARAVLWAGRKEPPARLKSIALPDTIPWPASGTQVVVETANPPTGALASACVRSRTDGQAVSLGVKSAAPKASFALPDLPAGEYFLDAWLLAPGGKSTIHWGSHAFHVTAECPLGVIALAQRAWNPGDSVQGTVALARTLSPDERVVVSLWDSLGRKLHSQTPPANATSVAFEFPPLRPLSTLCRVVAQLTRTGKVVCEAQQAFPVRARQGWDDFQDIIWAGAENNFLTHLMLRKLSQTDQAAAIDVGWRGNTNARNIALAGLAPVPYTARYGCFGAGADHVVPVLPDNAYGCMTSPVTLANLHKWGSVQSDMFGPYGPLCWTHGDETNYAYGDPNVCWSSTCLAAFRSYVKDAYPSLEDVNREWGTAFRSWDDVMPLTFREAKTTRAYARWIEHRLSSNHVFADFYHHSGEALSQHDPGARAGFDGGVGLASPNSGGDWWTLSRKLGVLQAYMGNSAQMELFRSFARPDQVRGMWYGTYGLTWEIGPNTVPYCQFFPWYSLLHQLNTTWFWTMGAPGPISGYAPDLCSLPFFEARTQALQRIRAGLGKLLLSGVRQNDGIAIHQSEASRIAESLYATKESDWSGAYEESLAGFNKALEDSGLQYQYVSQQEITEGALTKRAFRVLVLPHSRAVSASEAEEIRRFAAGGGVVVADLLPGVLNGHGTPQPQSLLADLFPDDRPGTVTPVGKGKAILLGDLLTGYARAHMDQFGWKRLPVDKSQRLAALLRDEAGVAAPVRVTPLQAAAMPPTEVTRFQCGAIEFVGLLREYFLYDNSAYRARVTFPRPSHLYDAMTGEYLGYTDRVETTIDNRAKLYALSPYRVIGLDLTVPATATAGSPAPVRTSLRTEGSAAPSRHAFRLEVSGPDGKTLPHYAQNLLTDHGVATAEIPWALNDAAGTYTVTARDVMSGIVAKRSLTLR